MAGSGEALVLHVLLCCLCQGVATIECRGHVWIEPAPVVRMGSDISITCRSALDCPSAQLLILLNYSRTEETPLVLDGSTVRLRLRDFRMPFATVACFSLCASNHRHRLVCGAEVRAGYPPDPPGNLSCAIAEGSECLQCAWDAGRDTHLPTRHSLHLRRLADDEDEEEEKTFPADSPVLLRELHNASHYSVWVQASNALGTARSAPRHLSLQELVVPALPVVIGAETTETSPPSTTTRWRSRTQLQNVHCEERHRATGTPTWHVELGHSVAQEGPRWQHELQSDTQFVFQVRCRLSTAHSPWSAWSPPFLYSTPEAAPAAAPGVWRRLGPALPNGSREVTVLIKPLPARDARGRILGYAVSAEGAEGTGTLCRTSGTECAVLVPPGARALLVTAHNSKGASSPASIPLNRGAGQEEFPAPEAVEVKPENQSRVLVQWQPPQHSQRPLLWFILEWVSSSQQHQEEQYFWEKVPHQETHTYIQAEAAAGAPLSVSLYAVYPDGISNPSSGRVPPEEPLLGSTYSEMSQDDDIGALLGLSLGVVGLAVLFAIVMFKKSVRKRIKATLVSLLPKWLFEEFPHMENSTVVKSLQDEGDFPSASLHEPFLASGDPTLTEIEEVPAQEEHGSPDTGSKPRAEVAEDRELPRSVVAPSSPSQEQLSAYRPQLSDGNELGYVAAGIYQEQPPAASPEPELGIFCGDYTSPVPQLWDQQGGVPQVCPLDKINLILNSSQAFPVRAGHGPFLENPWEQRPPSDVPEQMLVPEELLSCLRAVNRESVDVNPCFPQGMGRLF
ncbi:interleukin-23 receptor isoform X1 [Corvus moneduloides]|uniref:interleukin-23 receptor isoform X1 n=1 Tax=Corvus moneduloides TaxID=1196302 RepID=UPI0013635CED|nr:interleukin-23 receptor isoform X1 [Corvus moneduloides]XP_031973519.1 interleukin-23 receptor isoform X1 [Corvus moneduloides]XP_031973520.1 interleukin-23 receptor isoform X1 [Corvus moneduloides]